MTQTTKPAPQYMVVPVNNHDIAFAIMQGAIGLKAPHGTVAEDALRQAAASEPEMVASFYRSALNVMKLLDGVINRATH